MDVCERGRRRLLDHVEEKKVGNREIIQSRRDSRMPADTVERVAEHQHGTDARIVERFKPKLIARAK